MRQKLLAPLLIAALLGACATSQIVERPTEQQAPAARSATVEEALQVTGAIVMSVLSFFSVVVVVH